MSHSYSNPFSGINAVMLEPEKIREYWCDPFGYELFSGIKREDIYGEETNIVFMGGRSTGKSMFLRYWSYQVQNEVAKDGKIKLSQQLVNSQGVGFYFRVAGTILKAFYGHGQELEHWSSLFTHYFELLVGKQYIEILSILEEEGSIDEGIRSTVIPKICNLLGLEKLSDLSEIIDQFNNMLKDVELYLGNVPFDKKPFKPLHRAYLSQAISFDLASLIIEVVPCFEKLNVVLLIDEYENFLEYQQKVINTLLKFAKPKIKLRIAMRLEGFRTHETINADDFIKESREYRNVKFEEILSKENGYRQFLEEICKKRLERVPKFKENGITSIKRILTPSENLETEAKELTTGKKNRITEHFSKQFEGLPFDKVLCRDNPLLEILNCVWLTRGESVTNINKAMKDYLAGKENELSKKYKNDYVNKYKLSLMFLLCSIYHQNKMYYSFNTFAFLSSGIVGQFIELCRRSFAEADWTDSESLIKNGVISKELQHKAAMSFSNSEKQQVSRIEKYGGVISRFVENIGNIFRAFHLDIGMRYPETNQFAINVASIHDEELKEAIRTAIRWTVVQRKPKMQLSAPSGSLQDLYTINRIFSPNFQISYRTRGGTSIQLNEVLLRDLMTVENVKSSKFLSEKKKESKKKSEITPNLFGTQ